MKYRKVFGIVFLSVLVFIVGCGGGSKGTSSTEEINIQDTPSDEELVSSVPAPGFEDVEEIVVNTGGGVKTFDIIAKQWEFNPGIITVDKGDDVVLNIESIDVAHGIAIPDFGVNARLDPGKLTTVEFTADKSGEFTFFCSVRCGSGHSSMRGKLVVN